MAILAEIYGRIGPVPHSSLIIRELGLQAYQEIWDAMRSFTDNRSEHSQDELWALEHPPVFTQGQAGKAEHVLNPKKIPLIQTDRGGQVTYHGPGQIIVYFLLDIRRLGISPKKLVQAIERATINFLSGYGLPAGTRKGAPGIYVDGAKIGSIGLRIRRGCSYHGLALNVAMDLEPFSQINPCGFKNLPITQLAEFDGPDIAVVAPQLVQALAKALGYKKWGVEHQL